MRKSSLLSSQNGLTLVELLAGIVILSIISGMVISNLIGGLNSFKNINNQISLNDEANYIMKQFVNHIYVSARVELVEESDCKSIIKVTNRDQVSTTLGFAEQNAVVNGTPIQSDQFSFACRDSTFTVNDDENTVSIKMVIVDQDGKELELKNTVSYLEIN